MILLVSMVTPPQTCLTNKEEVENKKYQGVTNKTNKTLIIRLKINIKDDALHRSFSLFIFKTLLPCLSQCNEATKSHKGNHAPT
jgi:hypothetical protein